MYNDNYQWPRILATIPDNGPIYHMDYSENMAQMHKYEVQSAHFNKRNYSLHCTVEHLDSDKHPNLKSPYFYHYHFSDEMKHDSAFTSVVFEHCLETGDLPEIIRNKSDNCSIHYKCGKAFNEYLKLAKKYNRNLIKYYVPAGHGKGLVDAMSAFGVKTPRLKAVITHNFRYNSSQDICNMLQSRFESDNQKKYSEIDTADILSLRPEATAIPIKGSRSFHMMARSYAKLIFVRVMHACWVNFWSVQLNQVNCFQG